MMSPNLYFFTISNFNLVKHCCSLGAVGWPLTTLSYFCFLKDKTSPHGFTRPFWSDTAGSLNLLPLVPFPGLTSLPGNAEAEVDLYAWQSVWQEMTWRLGRSWLCRGYWQTCICLLPSKGDIVFNTLMLSREETFRFVTQRCKPVMPALEQFSKHPWKKLPMLLPRSCTETKISSSTTPMRKIVKKA